MGSQWTPWPMAVWRPLVSLAFCVFLALQADAAIRVRWQGGGPQVMTSLYNT
jgi:hypothetical protein